MTTWISLLRGINVGGKNSIRMENLRELLEGLGALKVKTYIQSGNCIFEKDDTDSNQLSSLISNNVHQTFGFLPQVLTLSKTDIESAILENPFSQQALEMPKSVHFYFLKEKAVRADLDGLLSLQKPNEKFHLTDKVFYLYAPEGVGRSKLATQAEKKLGVSVTARNFRTVSKIIELAA